MDFLNHWDKNKNYLGNDDNTEENAIYDNDKKNIFIENKKENNNNNNDKNEDKNMYIECIAPIDTAIVKEKSKDIVKLEFHNSRYYNKLENNNKENNCITNKNFETKNIKETE